MCLAVPGKIISISGDNSLTKTAKVNFSGVIQTVNLAYVPEASVGDYVIVHVGFALNILDEKLAQQTLDDLEQLERIL